MTTVFKKYCERAFDTRDFNNPQWPVLFSLFEQANVVDILSFGYNTWGQLRWLFPGARINLLSDPAATCHAPSS